MDIQQITRLYEPTNKNIAVIFKQMYGPFRDQWFV